MTATHCVARTGRPHIWPESIRITEAVQTAPDLSGPTTSPRRQLTISAVSTYLVAGWRWLERKRTQQISSRRMRLAETISLGEKRTISIVQVDGAQFLIGCSTGSVQLLARLDRQGDPAPTDAERAK